eukprot:m.21781 g.21781  ORF g.21781 m.21781 type:complete len:54 (+) comp33149_c0_seq1:276-437(+)
MDCSTFAFDLHVLGTPPALILSQDQTLKLNSLESHFIGSSDSSFMSSSGLPDA